MQSLKRLYESNDAAGIKRTKWKEHSGSKFLAFPKELMQLILKNLSFDNLDKLLSVSKIFWDIIKNSSLPAVKDFHVFNIIRKMSKNSPLNPRAIFWAQFQTTIFFEINESMKMHSISDEIEERRKLFPNANKLHINIESENLLKLNMFKGLSFISSVELRYPLELQPKYSKLHAQIIKLTTILPNLKEIILFPFLQLGVKLLDNAVELWSFQNHINELKSELAKRSIVCTVDSKIFPLDIENVLSSYKTESLRFYAIQQIFLKLIMGLTKIDNYMAPNLYDNINDFNAIYLSNIKTELSEFLDHEKCSIFKNIILNYKVDISFNGFTKELINNLLMLRNLKKIILKPEITISNNGAINAVAQIKHEESVRNLKNFLKERNIIILMDFSSLPNVEEEIMVDENNVLKEFKQKLIEANIFLVRKKLEKLFHNGLASKSHTSCS